MNTFRKVVAWIYSIQLFLVFPWFLGAIYRQEQSLWVWREVQISLQRHELGDAWLSGYLYTLFYSAFFVIPFFILLAWARVDPYPPLKVAHLDSGFLAGWVGGTFLIFLDPVFEFIRHIPTENWYGWLLMLWLIGSYFALQSFRSLRQRRHHLDDTRDT